MISTRPPSAGHPFSSSSLPCCGPIPGPGQKPPPLVISIALPLVLLLVTTNSSKGTSHLGGAYFVIGLCTAYGLAATRSSVTA